MLNSRKQRKSPLQENRQNSAEGFQRGNRNDRKAYGSYRQTGGRVDRQAYPNCFWGRTAAGSTIQPGKRVLIMAHTAEEPQAYKAKETPPHCPHNRGNSIPYPGGNCQDSLR